MNEALNQLGQKPDYSRVKRVPVTMDLLLEVFTTGQVLHAEVVQGIPPGSIIVRHSYDFATGFYWLMIQNNAFEPVERGHEIPILPIVCRRIEQAPVLPSAADLDADAEEKAISEATKKAA